MALPSHVETQNGGASRKEGTLTCSFLAGATCIFFHILKQLRIKQSILVRPQYQERRALLALDGVAVVTIITVAKIKAQAGAVVYNINNAST